MKYITVEEDLKRISNCLIQVDGIIDNEAFKSYGRHAHYYDKNYRGGKNGRIMVRRTMRNLNRLLIVAGKKLDIENCKDFDVLRGYLHLQTKHLILLNLITF